jgi:hypothetical protein
MFLLSLDFYLLGVRLETPSVNTSLSLSLIETFVEALQSLRFGIISRTDSSAPGTFDSVGREIITAFTSDIIVKYRHFESCVVPATWPSFVSCSFFQLSPIRISRF